MAQQHQLILARLVFAFVNRSPHLRLRSQNREPVSRNRGARQPHGRLGARQVEFAFVICRDFHGAALVPHDHERTHREVIIDRYQSVGLRIRHGAKQDAVHHAEDCRVRADSQHQRQNRKSGESRIPAYHTQSVSQVLPQILQPHAFPHVPRHLFHQFHISEFSPRCALRILPLLTAPCPLSRRHLQMAAHFLFEFRVPSLTPPETHGPPPPLLYICNSLLPISWPRYFSSGCSTPAIASESCDHFERSL